MTRTTPELAPHFPNIHTHQRDDIEPQQILRGPSHLSVLLGLEPRLDKVSNQFVTVSECILLRTPVQQLEIWYGNPVNDTVVTHVGAPVAWGLRIIDTAVATRLEISLSRYLLFCDLNRGIATAISMIRNPQSTGAPTCVTTVPLTGFPYLKKGPEGISIQSSFRASYASAGFI
ncbi:hypothetical protein TNCV_863611 [Trichonephila clavipes]|nr:hypothetical protein TNCV_863611 [Trichonephila clavipes]